MASDKNCNDNNIPLFIACINNSLKELLNETKLNLEIPKIWLKILVKDMQFIFKKCNENFDRPIKLYFLSSTLQI